MATVGEIIQNSRHKGEEEKRNQAKRGNSKSFWKIRPNSPPPNSRRCSWWVGDEWEKGDPPILNFLSWNFLTTLNGLNECQIEITVICCSAENTDFHRTEWNKYMKRFAKNLVPHAKEVSNWKWVNEFLVEIEPNRMFESI